MKEQLTTLLRRKIMYKTICAKILLLLTAFVILFPGNLLAGNTILRFSGNVSLEYPDLIGNLEDMLKADFSDVEGIEVEWSYSRGKSYEKTDRMLKILLQAYTKSVSNVAEDEIKLHLMIYNANAKLDLFRLNPAIKNDPAALKEKGILCVKDFAGKKNNLFDIEQNIFKEILNIIQVKENAKKTTTPSLTSKLSQGIVVVPPASYPGTKMSSYKTDSLISRCLAYLLTDDLQNVNTLKVINKADVIQFINNLDKIEGWKQLKWDRRAVLLGEYTNAGLCLDGRFIETEDKVRVDIHIRDTEEGKFLKAVSATGNKNNISNLEKELVFKILAAVSVQPTHEEKKIIESTNEVSSFDSLPQYAKKVENSDNKNMALSKENFNTFLKNRKKGRRLVIAMNYFTNRGNVQKYNYIGDSLFDMIMSDLSSIEGIHIVERAQVGNLINEKDLRRSAFANKNSKNKANPINAEYIIGGVYAVKNDIIKLDLKIDKSTEGYLTEPISFHANAKELILLEEQMIDVILSTIDVEKKEKKMRVVKSKKSLGPIAVMPFRSFSSSNESNDLGSVITALMSKNLLKEDELKLVEREDFASIVQELELSKGGFVKPEKALQVGKLIGADYFLIGSCNHSGDEIRIDSRIIETETGRVIKTLYAKGKKGNVNKLVDDLSSNIIKSFNSSISEEDVKKIAKKSDFGDYEYYTHLKNASQAHINARRMRGQQRAKEYSEQAIREYRSALFLKPEKYQYLRTIAYIYQDMRDYEKAIEAFNEYTNNPQFHKDHTDPKKRSLTMAKIKKAIGMNYKNMRKPSEAIKAYNEAIRTLNQVDFGNSKEHHIELANIKKWLGQSYEKIGKPQKAISEYDEALNIFEKYYGNMTSEEADEIKKSLSQEELAAFLSSTGNYVHVRELKANCLITIGSFDQAAEELIVLIDKHHSMEAANIVRSTRQFSGGTLEKKALKLLGENNKGNSELASALSQSIKQSGFESEETKQLFEQLSKVTYKEYNKKNYAKALEGFQILTFQENNFKQFQKQYEEHLGIKDCNPEELLEKMIDTAPENKFSQKTLKELQSKAKSFDEYAKMRHQLWNNPGPRQYLSKLSSAAECYSKLQRYEELSDFSEKALRKVPPRNDNTRYFYTFLKHIIVGARKSGQYEKAIKYGNLSLKYFPRKSYTYQQLGLLYSSNIRDYKKAIEIAKKGLEINSQDCWLRNLLARTYVSATKYDQAISEYETVLKKCDGQRFRNEAQAGLEMINNFKSRNEDFQGVTWKMNDIMN